MQAEEHHGDSSQAPNPQRAPIIVPPLGDHKATLIFLHGLGDTGPVQQVTVNRGMRMPSWFDVFTFHPDITEDEASVKEASQTLQDLVEGEEKNGVPVSNIFIGGISQGGAVALYTAFAVNRPVGGVVGLSTWFPLHKALEDDTVPKYNKNVPVLLCHGTKDTLVTFSGGQHTSQFIQSFNSKTEFKPYEEMAHTFCLQEMWDIKAFLEKLVGS